MKVAKINVDKNIEVLSQLVKTNSSLSEEEKTSIEETTEVVQILLDRLARKRLGKKSSEKSQRPKVANKKPKEKEPRNQLPSKRYPHVPVIEKELGFEESPRCPCCQEKMKDSGMRETVEQLSIIPKKYIIYRYLKRKYRCGHCHGAMKMASLPARIVPGSSYDDEFVVDVALSKYCDLLPIERYVAIAARNGLEGLPAQSLIGLTHHFANFLECIYEKQKQEVLADRVVRADETPHRMLEGHGGKKSWYLWGFSSETSCFFEIQDTRSGEVASAFLMASRAEILVSDVFSGYSKAVKDTNIYRREKGLPLLLNAYCNSHSRRKFKLQEEHGKEEMEPFLANYREIYHLEADANEGKRDKATARAEMALYFEAMKTECKKLETEFSPRSELGKAISYFWNNYEGLTLCLKDPMIPLDNNAQERLLRSPVIGRKTWYGNHSKRGARTTAVFFSIVGACHLNKINPREYFPFVVECLHRGESPPTPYEYSLLKGRSPPQD